MKILKKKMLDKDVSLNGDFYFKQDGYLDPYTSTFRMSDATYPLAKLFHLNQVRVATKKLNLLLHVDFRIIVQLVPFCVKLTT